MRRPALRVVEGCESPWRAEAIQALRSAVLLERQADRAADDAARAALLARAESLRAFARGRGVRASPPPTLVLVT